MSSPSQRSGSRVAVPCSRLVAAGLGLALMACGAPIYRFPGPLGSMGVAPVGDRAPTPSKVARKPPSSSGKPGERVAGTAVDLLGRSVPEVNGVCFADDCTGLVKAVYSTVGLELQGGSSFLFERAQALDVAHRSKDPAPGDVAFFDNTWDKNGNHKFDDPLTHVAVVVSVDADGTINMVHNVASGIQTLVMNLRHPDVRTDASGKRLNDYLRVRRKRDPKDTKYLAGELWAGFGSFWRLADQRVSLLVPADADATKDRS